MSKVRLVITAVVTEGRSQGEVARAYGVSQGWVSRLVARYRAEGEAAFEPRSRRPRTSPAAVSLGTVELIIRLRKELAGQGLDAGPHTIAWHLQHHHQIQGVRCDDQPVPGPGGAGGPRAAQAAAVLLYPVRRASCRMSAGSPTSSTGTWRRQETEIVSWIDDHSRYALSVTAHPVTTGQVTLATFRAAVAAHGAPASTLTDNGMVYTTRFSGGRGGRNALEHELRHLGITQKNGRPNHPQTQGKVERFQQTLQKWLTARPRAATLAGLQAQLDAFTAYYNTRRPHRSLAHRSTPATAYAARPKATPGNRSADTHHRVRTDRLDANGTVTLRHAGKLYHIGIGRTYARTHVLLLVQDLHIRVIHAATGELLRELELDPTRSYQPTGRPPGPPKQTPRPPRTRRNPEP